MKSKDKKIKRVLDICNLLLKNEVLNKKELANLYNVNEKTIQRDIEDIRCYFTENITKYGEIIIDYDKLKKGYVLKRDDEDLNMKSILVLIKILLESRALCKEEMINLSDVLLNSVSSNQKRHIVEIIGNERINYVQLSHKQQLIQKIWDLSKSIRSKNAIEIAYKKTDGSIVNKKVKPASIMFSEYYFYLLAYFEDYNSATIYRVDRIIDFKEVNEKFELEHNKKIEEGDLRKKTQFMFGGKVQRVVFEYYGNSLEAILDRLPTAEIIDDKEDKKIIKAEVLGNGIKIWVLSQGKDIKVLEPQSLVESIKGDLEISSSYYL